MLPDQLSVRPPLQTVNGNSTASLNGDVQSKYTHATTGYRAREESGEAKDVDRLGNKSHQSDGHLQGSGWLQRFEERHFPTDMRNLGAQSTNIDVDTLQGTESDFGRSHAQWSQSLFGGGVPPPVSSFAESMGLIPMTGRDPHSSPPSSDALLSSFPSSTPLAIPTFPPVPVYTAPPAPVYTAPPAPVYTAPPAPPAPPIPPVPPVPPASPFTSSHPSAPEAGNVSGRPPYSPSPFILVDPSQMVNAGLSIIKAFGMKFSGSSSQPLSSNGAQSLPILPAPILELQTRPHSLASSEYITPQTSSASGSSQHVYPPPPLPISLETSNPPSFVSYMDIGDSLSTAQIRASSTFPPLSCGAQPSASNTPLMQQSSASPSQQASSSISILGPYPLAFGRDLLQPNKLPVGVGSSQESTELKAGWSSESHSSKLFLDVNTPITDPWSVEDHHIPSNTMATFLPASPLSEWPDSYPMNTLSINDLLLESSTLSTSRNSDQKAAISNVSQQKKESMPHSEYPLGESLEMVSDNRTTETAETAETEETGLDFKIANISAASTKETSDEQKREDNMADASKPHDDTIRPYSLSYSTASAVLSDTHSDPQSVYAKLH
ncbi:hypothetical protein BASA60_007225 [Batrachochytrium salamandrivorans]|nr:hypothetical protein BASA60_007225 [Batrachochytrium salamandrivorans]